MLQERLNGDREMVVKGIQGELTNIKHILRKGHMEIY